ncbi:hypothetical protein [Paenibacillus sp. WLX2291]|uniref:hypothetical protein n=1 Tax=Paenibacillus sp. WLX2291 TaxID=3296934 RepID=UPI0039840426
MTKNLIVIGIIIGAISILSILFTYIFMKIVLPICESLGVSIAKRLKSTYWLYILELFFFVLMISFLVLSINLGAFSGEISSTLLIYFFVFIILIIIETSAYHEFRRRHSVPVTVGIIGWITHRQIWKSYLAKRFILFLEQLAHIFLLLVPLYLSLYLISIFHWEDKFYFITLLFLPIYSNIWVYVKLVWKKYYFRNYFQ